MCFGFAFSSRPFLLGVKLQKSPLCGMSMLIPVVNGENVLTSRDFRMRLDARLERIVSMPEDSQIHKYKTAGKPKSMLLLADKVIKTFHFPIVTSGGVGMNSRKRSLRRHESVLCGD